MPDGLQAQAALAPPPGFTADSSGIAQAVDPPPPLVAPAYALRHHVALEFPRPLPVAPPATGCYDRVGERGAPNSGIGASEEPETHDGCSRAGVWREWTEPILSPPIRDSLEALDLTGARTALGVHAPAGVFLSVASVGLLEENEAGDFALTPSGVAPQAGEDEGPEGLAQEEEAAALGATRPSPEAPQVPATPTPAAGSPGTAMQALATSSHGPAAGRGLQGYANLRANIRPSVRPPVVSKPGLGRGGGIAAAVELEHRQSVEAEQRNSGMLRDYDIAKFDPTEMSDSDRSDAWVQEDRDFGALKAQAEHAKEAARKNYNDPEMFKRRWEEELDRQRHSREIENKKQARDPARAYIKAGSSGASAARAARDSARETKNAADRLRGKSPAADKARGTSKAALKASREAEKAQRDVKRKARFRTKEQNERARRAADEKTAKARALALAARKQLSDAESEAAKKKGPGDPGTKAVPNDRDPPPPIPVASGGGASMVYPDCGPPDGCGECTPPCGANETCECHWEKAEPIPEGDGGEPDSKKGKGIKASAPPTVSPPGTPGGSPTGAGGAGPLVPPGTNPEPVTGDDSSAGGADKPTALGPVGARTRSRFSRHAKKLQDRMERIGAEVDPLLEKLERNEPLTEAEQARLEKLVRERTEAEIALSIVEEQAQGAAALADLADRVGGKFRQHLLREIASRENGAAGALQFAKKAIRDYEREVRTAAQAAERQFIKDFVFKAEDIQRRLTTTLQSLPKVTDLVVHYRKARAVLDQASKQLDWFGRLLPNARVEVAKATLKELKKSFKALGLPADPNDPFGIPHQVLTDLEQLQKLEVPRDPGQLREFLEKHKDNFFVRNVATEFRKAEEEGTALGAVLKGLGSASQVGGARLFGSIAASVDFLTGQADRAQERVAAIAAMDAKLRGGGFGVASVEAEYLRAFYGEQGARAAEASTALRLLAASGEIVGDPLNVAMLAGKGPQLAKGLRAVFGEVSVRGGGSFPTRIKDGVLQVLKPSKGGLGPNRWHNVVEEATEGLTMQERASRVAAGVLRRPSELAEKFLEHLPLSPRRLTPLHRLSRFVATATQDYDRATPILRLLKKLPGVLGEWEQSHLAIQAQWFRAGSKFALFPEGSQALRGLQMLGNAGFNLAPLPTFINQGLKNSPWLMSSIGLAIQGIAMAGTVGTGVYVFQGVRDVLREDGSVEPDGR